MSEQTEIKTPEQPEKPPSRLGLLIALVALAALAIMFLLPAVNGGPASGRSQCTNSMKQLVLGMGNYREEVESLRSASRRAPCANRLKQIALALHGYHDAHGSFPPAYIADENGRPMHSWRVLILPFLGHKPLYEAYDFNEAWDGPNNRQLANQPVSRFNCPADTKEPSLHASYLVVVGPGTMWPGSEPMNLDECTDEPSNTILVVEVANSGIHWMQPRDLDISKMALEVNPNKGRGISSFHTDGANMAFVDGSVGFMPETITPEVLRVLLTRSGDEASNGNAPG